MNTNDHDFDARLRRLHVQALAQVSPQTRFQLRRNAAAAPPQPSPMPAFAWPLAAVCAAGVLAIGLQWRQPDPQATAPLAVAAAPGDDIGGAYSALDETPDLYLWLASTDATLAME